MTAPSDEVLLRKTVNFLSPEATAMRTPEIIGSGIDAVASRSGRWIGGRVTVRRTHVMLAANRANAAVHSGLLDFGVAIADVEAVVVEKSIGTDIVRLDGRWGSIRFRCWGARKAADLIDSLRAETA